MLLNHIAFKQMKETVNIMQMISTTIKKIEAIMEQIKLHNYTVITFARFLGLSGL